ncbi:MAG: DUF4286 family protein [Undibacterium sp.]|nr:DUF4286 family protein [Undibacterium sp.]
MILYEVCVEVRDDLLVAFERYMREKHLPEIWNTGCFEQIRFEHTQTPVQESSRIYRTCYQAATMADYDRYLELHASEMRADFMLHFPEGCTPSRRVWQALQNWA